MRFLHLSICALFISFASNAEQAVQRIISLAPHATELAFEAGLGDKLVGVSEFSDYPKAAQSIERVANYRSVKIEKIMALKPDLIIVWPGGNPTREIEKLKQLGFQIYYTQIKTLDDIADNIESLSQYANAPSQGKAAAANFRQQLKLLAKRYNTHPPIRYFYQLSDKPIITLSQKSWPSEIFRFCGGENVFANSPTPYPQVGIEQVLVAQPEVIFTSEHGIENGSMWLNWQEQIPAVKQEYIWSLNSDWISRPTPRSLKAIDEVCSHFEQVRNN